MDSDCRISDYRNVLSSEPETLLEEWIYSNRKVCYRYMIRKNALYSDGTKDYRIPCEPEEFEPLKVRLRAQRGELTVRLFYGEGLESFKVIPMEKADGDEYFDYYEGVMELNSRPVNYYFEISDGEQKCYYNNAGAADKVQDRFHFTVTPGFGTPDWAKGAVIYQIYVDRFYNGDTSNDVTDKEYFYVGDFVRKEEDWYQYPASVGIREFYGGDLAGILKKLDYLKELGVEVLYLNPIFVSPSNHKYDTQDYDYVDPHFGVIEEDCEEEIPEGVYDNREAYRYKKRVTSLKNLRKSNELLIQLAEEAHERGMKVILDGVFNHCGSFHKWLDREGIYEGEEGFKPGAYWDKESPYRDYFNFREDKWPANGSYSGWWGYETLPKLNYEGSRKLYEEILKIAAKWVSPPYNCDGWRLDVAADLGLSREFNHRFWRDFRKAVKEANREAVILAEHYGDSREWLMGDEWDTVMNYDAFMEPLTWFLTGMEKHSDSYEESLYNSGTAFDGFMKNAMTAFQTPSLLTAMNELSNHDHSRFLTRTNKRVGRTATLGPRAAEAGVDKGVLREAVTVQMTWPGAPTIYYGDEAGLCGWTDPDNRRSYPWGREDMDLIRFHRDIIHIHKSYDALKTGSLLMLHTGYGYLCYGRFDKQDKFIIALNNTEAPMEVEIEAWRIGIKDSDTLSRLILTTREGYLLDSEMYYTDDGILRLHLLPVSSLVIKNFVES